MYDELSYTNQGYIVTYTQKVDNNVRLFPKRPMTVTFTDVVPCKKFSKGTNTCQYIVLHHTGWGSYKGNLKVLSGNTARDVSCHFLIWPNGEMAKIGTPEQIQRHAGQSERGNLEFMNNYAIGIELVDNSNKVGTAQRFTDAQRTQLSSLVKHLVKAYNIPEENILTHASITRSWSKYKKLWDGKSPSRKVDCDRQLWCNQYPNFSSYRKSFYI